MVGYQDNVFVNVVASIQYRAIADKANDAFYKLTNTRSQIQAYVFDGKVVPFMLQDYGSSHGIDIWFTKSLSG